jgi:CRISPR/Cas system CSM-associated protein Csm4 (group 5 of RAMP superfamily)
MNNYKITNKRSKRNYFLNEEELTNFFKKNKVQNYNIVNLTEQKRIKRNKIIDAVLLVCFFAATVLATILIIENNY